VGPATEIVAGDVSDPASLTPALAGIDSAYYLIHSMGEAGGFEDADRRGAQAFGRAAREAGVRRVVYLGGLGRGADLSPHLASRQEVGRILRESQVPTIELRASIILGSGSLSFEMIRALVEKLPVMIIPRWVRRHAQPIAIEDVIRYLLEALTLPPQVAGVFEIGGAECASYLEIMREYARARRLRRFMIPVPVLTPRLSSLWLGLVTPIYARIGRQLIDSIQYDTVVTEDRAGRVFAVRPLGLRAAIARALVNEDRDVAETRWSDAASSSGPAQRWGGVRFGSRLVDSRTVRVAVPPAAAFHPITRLGGRVGWYYGTWLWRLRGWLDLLVGGPGLQRGRRHPEHLAPGDTLDWWRVDAVEPPRLLRLRAEMRVPGRAWLQFEVDPGPGGSRIQQTAVFDPVGILGLADWYALYPLHSRVFSGMLRGIARAAAAQASAMRNDARG
jgi:uncharacterized protein YbjT (DUF2867 family)